MGRSNGFIEPLLWQEILQRNNGWNPPIARRQSIKMIAQKKFRTNRKG